ncbi:MAG: hypothetical protein V8S25_03230 [Faecalibacterium prausnitzii]
MNKRTLHRLFSVLMALVMAVSLLTGCGTKTAENVEKQEDAQTIQVYLWSTSLYENLCALYPVPAAGCKY